MLEKILNLCASVSIISNRFFLFPQDYGYGFALKFTFRQTRGDYSRVFGCYPLLLSNESQIKGVFVALGMRIGGTAMKVSRLAVKSFYH